MSSSGHRPSIPVTGRQTSAGETIARLATAAAFAGLSNAWFGVAVADEGGISFWLPGQYASLAAAPPSIGLSFASIYYHSSVTAGADESFARGGAIDVGVDGTADLALFGPTYGFDTEIFGARPALSLLGVYGNSRGSVNAILTGPNGQTISGHINQELTGFGDLVPQFELAWNAGVHNYMTYITGDIPVGAYDPKRFVNLSIGHGAIDVGGGYTYLNPKSGYEFSAVSGFTYNFENPDTDYQSGIDWHLDWGLSKFVSEKLQIGVAGYLYQQVSGDSGPGAVLGPFKSRVAGIGPQIGYFVPIGGMQGYLSFKGYGEFASENRPEGWDLWLSFVLTPKG